MIILLICTLLQSTTLEQANEAIELAEVSRMDYDMRSREVYEYSYEGKTRLTECWQSIQRMPHGANRDIALVYYNTANVLFTMFKQSYNDNMIRYSKPASQDLGNAYIYMSSNNFYLAKLRADSARVKYNEGFDSLRTIIMLYYNVAEFLTKCEEACVQ